MDFQSIRKEYESEGIRLLDLHEDPIVQFRLWFEVATEQSPGKWFETNAMTLATATSDGKMSSRTVLLKGIRDDGFVFYSNYDSQKGTELAANPRAALLFHWPYLGRQVRIEGEVVKTSREDSIAYFHSRPRGSQIGAAVSNQSREIESRERLEKSAEDMDERLKQKEIPCPENWGGYLVKPERLEFWQGRLNRLHDRIVYVRLSGKWERKRICP